MHSTIHHNIEENIQPKQKTELHSSDQMVKCFSIVESYVSHYPTSKHQCTCLGSVPYLNSQASNPVNEGWNPPYHIWKQKTERHKLKSASEYVSKMRLSIAATSMPECVCSWCRHGFESQFCWNSQPFLLTYPEADLSLWCSVFCFQMAKKILWSSILIIPGSSTSSACVVRSDTQTNN